MHNPFYRERLYRKHLTPAGLVVFQVAVRETDLYIAAEKDLSALAYESVYRYRSHIENYIRVHPEFLTALSPLPGDDFAPEIVQKMLAVARLADVGPMASVAGAMAEFVGRALLHESPQVMVENGGDIYVNCGRDVHIGVFAGMSALSNKLQIKISSSQMPLGICTSSGTVGPSLSFGKADAVCVLSQSAALADAVASQIGNRIKSKTDIQYALQAGAKIPGVLGMLAVMDRHMGAWGEIALAES